MGIGDRESARLLRELREEIGKLKEKTKEGIPSLLRNVEERMFTSDTVATTVESAGDFIWDQDFWDNEKWQ